MREGNTLLTKFSKKEWGTWNIDGWFLTEGRIPAENTVLLAGADTDWEYVFRVSEKPDAVCEFSGGNHGKESLNDITFINPQNDSEIVLPVNKTVEVECLRIVEKTSLFFDDNCTKKYADVQRKYFFLPSKIVLETEFSFLSDVYMGTSYVCMFPVPKEYGRYAKFMDTGNIVTTPGPGTTATTNTFENFLGKEKTKSVQIWGDINPSYKFNVWIENEEMVDNFNNKLKVFYWDMNRVSNKLYFSKYDNEAYTKIHSGTKWYNKAGWEISISNDEGT